MEGPLHLDGSAHSELRRTVEDGQDAVAEVVDNEALVLADAGRHMGEVAVDEGEDFAGLELLADAGEVAQVGEHHGGLGAGARSKRGIERRLHAERLEEGAGDETAEGLVHGEERCVDLLEICQRALGLLQRDVSGL